VLDQDFTANAPNEKWVSDMTPRVIRIRRRMQAGVILL
jgi:hypothetical protein